MSFRNDVGMLAISVLLAGGCGQGSVTDLDDGEKAIKVCNPDGTCTSPNCDDINNPDQGDGSDFSMTILRNPNYRYKLTGFYQDDNGSWMARGYLVEQHTKVHSPADGPVKGVLYKDVQYPLVNLTAEKTLPMVTFCTSTSMSTTSCLKVNQKIVKGTSLSSTQIVIAIPVTPGGSAATLYTLSFTSGPQYLNITKPNSPDVYGLGFTFESKGINPASLCTGAGGVAQRATFYQGAHWDPSSYARTVNSDITVTCELGAIAACMSWGYKPWELTSYHGASQSKADWHATCVHAKTADYCGDGDPWTHYGTQITVKDPLAPQVMSDVVNNPEAYWTTTGAACVNPTNRRIPGLNWNSCLSGNNTTAMPDCSTFDSSNYLITGIP